MTRRSAILVLLAFALGIYIGNASEPALADDADAPHAIVAREMLESGDWAVMHMNGIRYLEKAPLHYWIVALTYKLLGQGAFQTRLPLALAVAGLVLMVYAFGRHFFGERAGFYAGLVTCTSIGTYIFTRTMIPEAIYALEFTAAFYLFLRAWQGTLPPRAGYWGCSVVVALAVLTRGLIGVIFPAVTITLFLFATGGWSRISRDWRKLPLLSSALIFLLIALPWHLVVGLRTPGFFSFYIFNEHILRAIGARYPQDYSTVPLGLWWLAHLIWFFPWSFFLPHALKEIPPPRAWRSATDPAQPGSIGARLLVFVWVGFILLFFSISKRMEYYSFGAWPGIAILLGLGLARAEEKHSRWLPRLQAALAVVGLLAAGVLGAMLWVSRNVQAQGDISTLLELKPVEFYRVAMASFFDLTPQAFAALRVPAAGAALSLLFGLGVAWLLRRRGKNLAANLALALGMAGFLFSANLGYKGFEPHMSSRPLARAVLEHLKPDDQIVIYGDFYGGSAVAYYTHRKVWLYNGRYASLEFGSNYPDAPRIFLTDREFPAFWGGPHRVFLLAPQHHRQAVLVRLPADATYLLAEIGGRAVYVNHPLAPGQPTLAGLSPR